MKDELIFIDEDNENRRSIFHLKLYYDFILELISKFFKKNIEYNEFHRHFLKLLDSIENYEDINNIYSELPFFWAMSIIENKNTSNTLMGDDLSKYIKFAESFKQSNNVNSFIELIDKEI